MSERNPDELGALWEKTSARGVYMTGTINGEPVVLFRNDRKAAGSKQPDWRVMQPQKRDERVPAPMPERASDAMTDDEIPF